MRPLTCHRVAPGRRSSGALRLRLQLGQRGGAPAGGRRVSALQPPESEGCCGVTGRQGSSAPGQGDAPPWCWPRPGRGSEALLQVRKPRAPGGVGPRLPCERHSSFLRPLPGTESLPSLNIEQSLLHQPLTVDSAPGTSHMVALACDQKFAWVLH